MRSTTGYGRLSAIALMCMVGLSACDRSEREKSPRVHPRQIAMKDVEVDVKTVERMAAAAWTGPAAWKRITVLTDRGEQPAIAGRNGDGVRFLTATGDVGYTITRGSLNCQRKVARLQGSISTAKDDVAPDLARKGAPAGFLPRPDQVAIVCAAPPAGEAPLMDGVQQLRKAQQDERARYAAPPGGKAPMPPESQGQRDQELIARSRAEGRTVTDIQPWPGMPQPQRK